MNRNLSLLELDGHVSFETSTLEHSSMLKQLQAYRTSCGDRIEDNKGLSIEKLRRRRIADCEVFLDDDGFAAPGNDSYLRTVRPANAKMKTDVGRIRPSSLFDMWTKSERLSYNIQVCLLWRSVTCDVRGYFEIRTSAYRL